MSFVVAAGIVKVKSVSEDNGNKKAIAEIRLPIHRGELLLSIYLFLFWKVSIEY